MNESKSLVDVALYLRGDFLDPAQVTSMLGVTASMTRVKGEKWKTSTNHEVVAKIGVWELTAPAEIVSLSDRIAWLRKKLSSAIFMPLQIPGVSDAELSVFIALGSNDWGGGSYESELTAEDIKWLGSLGVRVTFDLTYIAKDS